MKGYIDLHCHYLPAVDDGVRTVEESVRLVTGLHAIGYDHVVTTPHIRTAMFPNRRAGLEAEFAKLVDVTSDVPSLPQLGLGAEHFLDDVFWELFHDAQALPYPGGHAALVELPPEAFPMRLEERFFKMQVKGVLPVLAHPERYAPLFKSSVAIDPLLEVGVLPQLDLMSLTGRYGRHPRKAAERMLEEGVYYLASTDCHKPADVEVVEEAIQLLHRLVGAEEAYRLLAEHPRRVLAGTVD